MRNRRRRGIVFNGFALTVFSITLIVLGIAIGLTAPGIIDKIKTAADGSHEEAAPPVLDAPESESADDTSEPEEEVSAQEQTDEASHTDIEATDDPENSNAADEKVLAYVESMSLREKICQMLIVSPDSITGVSNVTIAGPITKEALESYPVGGLIHFAPNITSGEQIILYNSNVQSYTKTPMFISIDEEGGRVGRLKSAIGAHSVGAMLTYEKDGEDGAVNNAKILSSALEKYGFNTDFAPVADVWSNPANTVIGDRAYSSDFDNASKLVSAAVRGFNESNIVCSVKHFPGHGDTREDSHDGTAYVHKTLDELRTAEFKPFIAGIAAGADMVMVGHLVVPTVDELPATLSKKLVTDVLRGELGFDGVVITDALAMGAISSNYSTEYVAVTAVKAGIDILLMPSGIDRTISALTSAVESGDIPESRIDESVARIIGLKASRGIITL